MKVCILCAYVSLKSHENINFGAEHCLPDLVLSEKLCLFVNQLFWNGFQEGKKTRTTSVCNLLKTLLKSLASNFCLWYLFPFSYVYIALWSSTENTHFGTEQELSSPLVFQKLILLCFKIHCSFYQPAFLLTIVVLVLSEHESTPPSYEHTFKWSSI